MDGKLKKTVFYTLMFIYRVMIIPFLPLYLAYIIIGTICDFITAIGKWAQMYIYKKYWF